MCKVLYYLQPVTWRQLGLLLLATCIHEVHIVWLLLYEIL